MCNAIISSHIQTEMKIVYWKLACAHFILSLCHVFYCEFFWILLARSINNRKKRFMNILVMLFFFFQKEHIRYSEEFGAQKIGDKYHNFSYMETRVS